MESGGGGSVEVGGVSETEMPIRMKPELVNLREL